MNQLALAIDQPATRVAARKRGERFVGTSPPTWLCRRDRAPDWRQAGSLISRPARTAGGSSSPDIAHHVHEEVALHDRTSTTETESEPCNTLQAHACSDAPGWPQADELLTTGVRVGCERHPAQRRDPRIEQVDVQDSSEASVIQVAKGRRAAQQRYPPALSPSGSTHRSSRWDLPRIWT